MHKFLIYWWLIACLQMLGVAIAFKFGMYNMIVAVDYTKITLLILGIHLLASIITGYYTWKKQNKTDVLWYIAETQLSLGMIGTLIGFMIMLNAAFGHVDASNIEAIKTTILQIGSGMGIAIRATLLGLISGVIIKFGKML
jgi:uncharacterized iron-regulated membrane protein